MLQIEYDRVVGYHGYRCDMPHELGGTLLATVDGVNCGHEERAAVSVWAQALERRLIADAVEVGIEGRADNHHGFTVEIGRGPTRPPVHLQVRFSDWSVYLWLMPGEG